MEILKDGKIDTTMIKAGDFIRIKWIKEDKSYNGMVAFVRPERMIANLFVEGNFDRVIVGAKEIEHKEVQFEVSSGLSCALIKVNFPEVP